MQICIYISDFTKFEPLYSHYRKTVAACFSSAGSGQVERLLESKESVEKYLKSLQPIQIFDEEEYDREIRDDEETKMLLKNGLYTKEKVINLISRQSVSDAFQSRIKVCLGDVTDNEQILFWNA